jgi:hypothetical protein
MEDVEQHEAKEIKEYERLIEFARQIQDGLHPRIKIPSRLPHLVSLTLQFFLPGFISISDSMSY